MSKDKQELITKIVAVFDKFEAREIIPEEALQEIELIVAGIDEEEI